MPDDWPFDQGPSCAAITVRQIIDGSQPILHVTHDSEDHGWQFLGAGGACAEDAAIVAMSEIVNIDPSVLDVADMPPGWQAWRPSVDEDWVREPEPE